ncbi:hypothetical protein Hdeb2414_s0009g00314661 [Helianthus debilis subsp. tardiflorus]
MSSSHLADFPMCVASSHDETLEAILMSLPMNLNLRLYRGSIRFCCYQEELGQMRPESSRSPLLQDKSEDHI